MKIIERKITVAQLYEGYVDLGDNGVFAYNGKLTVRPSFQREFIYENKQRNAVIDTVLHGYPLNIMYWSLKEDGTYELLDGQQRTISICQYRKGDFSLNHRYYHNLFPNEKDDFDNYELTVYVCEGTDKEKLEWFRIINMEGVVLTPQEMLNAIYAGPWLNEAKFHFSKRKCTAVKYAEGYMGGNPLRQEYLKQVLNWIADRDGLKSGEDYMAIHQFDEDDDDLFNYFKAVIDWAKITFSKAKVGSITKNQDWGLLYNKYHGNRYDSQELAQQVEVLLMDDEVTKYSGVIPYVLSPRTKYDEKFLSLRQFTKPQKLRQYEKQHHQCPYCLQQGIEREYAFEEMEGDHIVAWSQGGTTTESNLQMLCKKCNNDKRDK